MLRGIAVSATILAMRLRLHAVDPPAIADALTLLRAVAESTRHDYALLHSASGGTSLLGFEPLVTLEVDAAGGAKLTGNVPLPAIGDLKPLEALQAAIAAIEFDAPDAPHPLLGWLGFISYDLARTLETIPPHAAEQLHWPLIRFSLYKHYVLFEGTGVRAYALGGDVPPPSLHVPAVEVDVPTDKVDVPPLEVDVPRGKLRARQARGDFEAKVRRVKEYIAAGDIYQANLAQRWVVETPAKPHEVFCRLCEISPAPYAACMRFTAGAGGREPIVRHVVSASPELFLHLADGTLTTRPIKGTRPRDRGDAGRDAGLRAELLASAKDRAELTMIVDLLRNDLGRVSEYGSVRVTEARGLEAHPTVWHTVATIESRLRAGVGLAELLAAVCPGGSITGAPKIRAMQIIEELEGASAPPTGAGGFRRALYCGNMGAIGPGARSVLLNIAIRTILFQGGAAHVYAGGGIVADSEPGKEYEETLHKAAAMFRALGVSVHGG